MTTPREYVYEVTLYGTWSRVGPGYTHRDFIRGFKAKPQDPTRWATNKRGYYYGLPFKIEELTLGDEPRAVGNHFDSSEWAGQFTIKCEVKAATEVQALTKAQTKLKNYLRDITCRAPTLVFT